MLSLPLFKGITGRDRQFRSIVIVRQGGNGGGCKFGECREPLFMKRIPQYDCSIGSARGKCPVNGVEGDGVDGVDGVSNSMAFEGVFFSVFCARDVTKGVTGHVETC